MFACKFTIFKNKNLGVKITFLIKIKIVLWVNYDLVPLKSAIFQFEFYIFFYFSNVNPVVLKKIQSNHSLSNTEQCPLFPFLFFTFSCLSHHFLPNPYMCDDVCQYFKLEKILKVGPEMVTLSI
jgi:hypothetical protein